MAGASRESLQQALRVSSKGRTSDLDRALAWGALRICLENTAAVLPQIGNRPIVYRPKFDAKRAAAGDND